VVECVQSSNTYLILCLLPSHTAAVDKQPLNSTAPNSSSRRLNMPLLRTQLRALQLIDAVRLHKQGYHMTTLIVSAFRAAQYLHYTYYLFIMPVRNPVRDCGFPPDSELSMKQHINAIARTCSYLLRRLYQIRL